MKVGCVRLPALSARVGMNWIKATRLLVRYRNHHLRRPDIDILEMDDIRQSFSRLKKDFKHRLGDKKRGANRAGVNATEETAGSRLSPTQPDSRATAGGHDEEGGGINVDVSTSHSRDRSPQPEPIQADEGGDNPQGREVEVDERGAGKSRLRLGTYVWGAGESRPSRKIKRVPSPLSVTPISSKQEADGAWALSPQ